MKKQLLIRSLLAMFVFFAGGKAFAQSESCGFVTLELIDSYGDGWNGNDIDFVSTSGTTTYTLSSGYSTTYSLAVSFGDTLDFVWQAGGSYASECTYKITDAAGTTLYTSPTGSVMTAGATQYYVYCNTASSCAMPTNLAVSTGTNSAALSWDGASSYSYHLVEYDTTGFTPGTGDTAWVYADTAYLTGLMASTSYDFYVTTICSSTDSSITVSSLNVFTQCAAIATPWTDNLDAASSGGSTNPSLPTCWEYYTGVSNASIYATYHYIYSYISNSSSNSLRTYRSSTSSYVGDTAMSLTPEIQGLDSATKMLEFYGRKGYSSYPGEVIIGVTNAAGDASSLTIVDTVYMNSDAFEKYTVYLDAAAGVASGDARVAFVTVCNGVYDYMYMDDITVKDIPPCPEPIGLSLAATTQASATISWSSSSAAFNIEVGPMGFTQGTGTSYSSTTTSYTATGLTQNTYYDAYVMANCTSTGDGTSNWVGPFTFKTECGDQAVPYSNGFEGFSSGNTTTPNLPDCWAYGKTGTSSSLYAYNYNYSFYSNTGTNSVRFYGYASTTSTNSADGDTLAAFSPRIAGLSGNDKQVIFNVRTSSSIAYYTTKMIIATADSNASMGSIHIVDTVNYSNVYQEFTVDLDNVPTNASRVVFMIVPEFVSGYTYAYAYAYLDDIEIRDIPNCPIALNASGNATSDSSVTLTWVDSTLATNYIIEWGPSGFTQGTGAPTDTVAGTTWSINTLDDATTYDFYIQSNCMSTNGSMSPWVGPISVTVPCSPTQKTYIEGFENLAATFGSTAAPNLADCWVQDRGSAASYVRGMSNTYGTAYGSGYMEFWGMAMVSDTVVLSSPPIENLSTEGAEVTFYAMVNSATYLGELEVGTSDYSGSISSSRAATGISLSTSWQEFSVYLDSNFVQSGDARVAFILPEGNGQCNDSRIDSVTIADLPTCGTYNHVVSSVSDTSADLTWEYFGNDCFTIEYGLAGFVQGTGVGAQSGTLDSNITSNYSISGLSPNTTYDFYVENCCNPGTWEGPFTFTTECTGPLAAGTYSVGPTGDFATMDSVISTLNVCGIAGAVTFELQSGSHAGGTIGAVNGVSSTNTITFSGASAANDTLGPLVLDGASYVNLEDLYIRATGGFTVRLNATEYVNITGCTIETSSAASTANIPIVASASATSYSSSTEGEQYLTISDNTIFGGYFGMAMYGSSSSLGATHDVTVSNNDFVGQYYYGLYLYYARDVQVSDNYFGQFVNSTNYAGYLYQMDGCRFTGNEVESYYSILAYYWNTSVDATVQSEISNNMFKNGYYGLRIYYGAEVGVYHNTIVGSTYGLYDYYNGSSLDYRNNIIQGGTYAMYSYNSGSNFDYNVYNSLGSTLAYIYNGSFNYPTDLTSLQAVDTTMNMNSKVGN